MIFLKTEIWFGGSQEDVEVLTRKLPITVRSFKLISVTVHDPLLATRAMFSVAMMATPLGSFCTGKVATTAGVARVKSMIDTFLLSALATTAYFPSWVIAGSEPGFFPTTTLVFREKGVVVKSRIETRSLPLGSSSPIAAITAVLPVGSIHIDIGKRPIVM